MDIVKSIEHEQLKSKVPTLNVGDTVRVHIRVKEGNRERIQVFEGIIIKKQGGGVNATFTVRRISYGVGVEKTFLVHSPRIEKVEVIRVGKARRAKLYYLRDRVGKSAKTKEKIGARIPKDEDIETQEEVLAEEIPAEEAVVEESIEATPEVVVAEVVEEVPVVEEVKEEPAKEESAEAPEEAPAIETEAPIVEETVDTVSEETVEVVEEAPAVAETETVEDETEKSAE